jgi:hypothetical protein
MFFPDQQRRARAAMPPSGRDRGRRAMMAMLADDDVGEGGPFDRDVLSTAMAMLERYGERALNRARNRVAWLSGPRNARVRLLWMHVVVAIAFLEGTARWRSKATVRQ